MNTTIPQAIPDFLPYPQPGEPVPGVCDGGTNAGAPCQVATQVADCPGSTCTEALDSIAGPARNFDATLIGYEGGFASPLVADTSSGLFVNDFLPTFIPGRAGNRWQIGVGFWAVESSQTFGIPDYGLGADDFIFEWKEHHPEDEAILGHPPACSRFGGQGEPAGGQCASLTVDRTHLHECNETITVTLFDAKCVAIGAGNSVPLGGPCTTDPECGAGGDARGRSRTRPPRRPRCARPRPPERWCRCPRCRRCCPCRFRCRSRA